MTQTRGQRRTNGPAAPLERPDATVDLMVICVSEQVPSQYLAGYLPYGHFGVPATLEARFWAGRNVNALNRKQMFGLRPGKPALCAGGPVRLLGLDDQRYAEGVRAGLRHQQWSRVVRGTREATPKVVYLSQHLANPEDYPLEHAEADFYGQPRVQTMELHNIESGPNGCLPLSQLEMFQAGPCAYQSYCALKAITHDAVLCTDGKTLAPASDALSDQTTFLRQATGYLGSLLGTQRLFAVAVDGM